MHVGDLQASHQASSNVLFPTRMGGSADWPHLGGEISISMPIGHTSTRDTAVRTTVAFAASQASWSEASSVAVGPGSGAGFERCLAQAPSSNAANPDGSTSPAVRTATQGRNPPSPPPVPFPRWRWCIIYRSGPARRSARPGSADRASARKRRARPGQWLGRCVRNDQRIAAAELQFRQPVLDLRGIFLRRERDDRPPRRQD
jgi:hypothetical protein